VVYLTFLHVFRLGDAFPDLLFVCEIGFGHEGFVKSGAKVVVAEGVLAAEIE
jgi:hypothetical protein